MLLNAHFPLKTKKLLSQIIQILKYLIWHKKGTEWLAAATFWNEIEEYKLYVFPLVISLTIVLLIATDNMPARANVIE